MLLPSFSVAKNGTMPGRRVRWSRLGRALLAVGLLAPLVVGCGAGPGRIALPEFDPQADAARAIEEADQNGDGSLTADELEAMPGLLAATTAIDADDSGSIDADELAARIQSYVDSKTGVMSLTCVVNVDGNPLDEATVEFIPEKFLADVLKPARATTRRDGAGPVKLADGSLPGIAPGIYRVTVSKQNGGRELVPERYNADTELGFEVSLSNGGRPAVFNLSSR